MDEQYYSIILRHDTSTQWMVNDPILALGEYGVEDDTHRVKRGDGDSKWSTLPYEDFGLDYMVSYENLKGEVNDNEALKIALAKKVDKSSFEDVNNNVVAGLEIADGVDGNIAQITKLNKNVLTNGTVSNILYIKSSDNSLLGYWAIDELGVKILDLKAKSSISDFETNHAYYTEQLCYYNNGLYRALENFVSTDEFDTTKWTLIASLNAKDIKYDNRTSHLDSITVKDAIDELKDLDSTKLRMTTRPSKVYGTDDNGEQLLYDKDSLRTVDTVNGVEASVSKNIQIDADDINYDDTASVKKTIREMLDSKVDKVVAGRNEKIVKDITVSYGVAEGSLVFDKTLVSLEDGATETSKTSYNIVSETELSNATTALDNKIDGVSTSLNQLITDTSDTLDRKIDRTKSELEDAIEDTSIADRAYTNTAKSDMLDELDGAETRLNTRITTVNNTLQGNIDTVEQTAQDNLDTAVADLEADITTKYNRLDGKIDTTASTLQSNIDTNYNTLNTKITNYKAQTDSEIAEGLALKINKSIADSLVSGIEVSISSDNPTFKIISKNTNSGNASTNHIHFVSRGNIAITTVDEDHIQFDVSAIDTINTTQNTHLDALDTSIASIGTRLVNHDTKFASIDTQLATIDGLIHDNTDDITELQSDLADFEEATTTALEDESTARINADSALADDIADINTELSTTIAGQLSDLDTAIQTEASDRADADTAINQTISTNVTNLTNRIVAIETVDTTQNSTLAAHTTSIGALGDEDTRLAGLISSLSSQEATDVSGLNTRVTAVESGKIDKSIFVNTDDNILATSEFISNNGLYGILNANVCANGANYGTVTQDRIDFTSSDNTIVSTIVRDENDKIISIDLRANLDTDVNYFITSQTLDTTVGNTNYVLVSSLTPTDKQNPEVQDIVTDSAGTWARITAVGRVDEQDRPIVLATTFHRQASAVWGTITGNIADQADLGVRFSNVAQGISSLDSLKVNKVSTANRIYGTDANGDQTTYGKDALNNIDSVNGVSPDANKDIVITGEDIPVTSANNPFSLYNYLSRGSIYEISGDLTKQRVNIKNVLISADKSQYTAQTTAALKITGGADGANNTSVISVTLANTTDVSDNVSGPEFTLTVNPQNIIYDNQTSGLVADTMQGAIDELVTLDSAKVTTTTYNTKMTALDNSISTLTSGLASANTAIGQRVEKTSSANKIYGTDTNGDQTTYNKADFGAVDTVNSISPDANKNITVTGKNIVYSSTKATNVSDIINNLVDINQSSVTTSSNALNVAMKTANTVDTQQTDTIVFGGNNNSDILFTTDSVNDIINLKVDASNVDVTVGATVLKLQAIINTLNTNLSNLTAAFENTKKIVGYVQGTSLKAGDYVEITSSNSVVYLARVVANYTADTTKATAMEGFTYDVEQGNLMLIGIPEQV